ARMIWTFDVMEDLINLRNEYRKEFKNVLNTEHAAIWDDIATEINNYHPAQVTSRQCQVKWTTLVHDYENSRRIRVENPEGFLIRSPNRFN
ncbi:12545_t:CDS:1, partial [Funneliformis geosporum]